MRSVEEIKGMKGKEKISMLTCYDATMAGLMDMQVDLILVGDSYGMVMLGYDTTQQVTMPDMTRAAGAVCRGAKDTLIVGDLPYGAYENEKDALENAQALMKAGCHAVKLEGKPEMAAHIVKSGIPVMGHIGLTPQTITDFKVQGKSDEDKQRLLKEAREAEAAGCFALVLECVPESLAREITEAVSMPTIGIGAGFHCDGQVLVAQDMLGMFEKFKPKFVKRFGEVGQEMRKAFRDYTHDVKAGKFPDDKHSFH